MQLCVVDFILERGIDRVEVAPEAVRRQLDAVAKSLRKVADEQVRVL